MHKIIALCAMLSSISFVQGITLGQNLLNNSPLLYLLDLDKFINDPSVTRQIGDVLYTKNFLESVTPHGTLSGSYTEKPSNPAEGYTSSQGQWALVPSSLGATNGTWYWILRALSYYLSIFTRVG